MPDRRKVGFAILLMVGATLCFAALDATSKYLSRTYPIPMMVWGRYTFHCLMMLIFLAPSMRLQLIATTRPVAQITRALMLTGTTGFSMAGFSLMPLAESTAFLFVTPLVVVILSHWLLKESITRGHWIAVRRRLRRRPADRPARRRTQLPKALSGCRWPPPVMRSTRSRRASSRRPRTPLTMLFYTALVGTVSMTLAAPLYWGGPTPGWIDAALIASLGIYGGTGHLMLTRAFRYAAASFLSPFPLWPIDLGRAARLDVLRSPARPAVDRRHGGDRRQQPLHRARRTLAPPRLMQ
jgi:drug/metabolite transporter (DMT)-like permease